MQCKDISDLPVLKFLQMLEQGQITMCHASKDDLVVWQPLTASMFKGFANSIFNALPYGADYPDKLLIAKVKSMVRKGLIDGCFCGCRGDIELTDKGRSVLQPN